MYYRLGQISFLAFIISACVTGVHIVYLKEESKVIDGASKEECRKVWSSWDGERLADYYAAPCDVLLERKARSGEKKSIPIQVR